MPRLSWRVLIEQLRGSRAEEVNTVSASLERFPLRDAKMTSDDP